MVVTNFHTRPHTVNYFVVDCAGLISVPKLREVGALGYGAKFFQIRSGFG
jgi:hypothetical protein